MRGGREGCEGVVRDVEFFEGWQAGEVGDGSEAVGFQVKDFEGREVGDVLGALVAVG